MPSAKRKSNTIKVSVPVLMLMLLGGRFVIIISIHLMTPKVPKSKNEQLIWRQCVMQFLVTVTISICSTAPVNCLQRQLVNVKLCFCRSWLPAGDKVVNSEMAKWKCATRWAHCSTGRWACWWEKLCEIISGAQWTVCQEYRCTLNGWFPGQHYFG